MGAGPFNKKFTPRSLSISYTICITPKIPGFQIISKTVETWRRQLFTVTFKRPFTNFCLLQLVPQYSYDTLL